MPAANGTSIVKDWADAAVRLALAYPDTYEIGMSNLGLAILYDLVNREPDMRGRARLCPLDGHGSGDARGGPAPLFAWRRATPCASSTSSAFRLQHELNYTNVLEHARPGRAARPRRRERTRGDPLIIAGGSGTYNPEPMADFFDLFVIGEGEEVLLELLRACGAARPGAPRPPTQRDLLRAPGAAPRRLRALPLPA